MYLLLPDLYLFFYHQNLNLILISFFVLVYLYSLIKSTKFLFLFLPFLICIPAYLYYISIYHIGINEQILSIVAETDIQEALQFLGGRVFLCFIVFIFWLLICIYFVIKHYRNPNVWQHWSRSLVLTLGTCYFVIGFYFNEKVANEMTAVNDSENTFLVEEENGFLKDLKQTYPLGLLINGYNIVKEQKKINQAYEKNNNFKFNAKSNEIIKTKEIYVLVLGETGRRENWQLNGYARNTNPLLNLQENLVNFTDFISISSATRSSIPMMLTRKSDKDVYRYEFPEKSVISAFREAGFKTYWLSTQQKFGAFDTSTSVYAKETDEMHFLNKTGYTNAGEYDDVLIPLFNKIVVNPEKKKLIVIHTLGSHYNYVHRYPLSFAKFKPDLSSLNNYSLQEIKYKKELRNSYDNSIVFTDYVLNNFIQILKSQTDSLSFLLYSSDHGEDLFDKKCLKSGHGLETARNFEIAGFAWYSDEFENKFPTKVKILKQNKDRKINQTSIFPSLIDAADISIPNDSLSKSVLKDFKNYPRLVMGGRNYDQAKFIGECKEIK